MLKIWGGLLCRSSNRGAGLQSQLLSITQQLRRRMKPRLNSREHGLNYSVEKSWIFTSPAKPMSVTLECRGNHHNADHWETKSNAQEIKRGLVDSVAWQGRVIAQETSYARKPGRSSDPGLSRLELRNNPGMGWKMLPISSSHNTVPGSISLFLWAAFRLSSGWSIAR